MAAGDMDRVVTSWSWQVASVRRNRREATFMGWLKALPDEAIRRSPVLSVFSAYAHMASGSWMGSNHGSLDAERELARIPTGSERPWADTDELRTLPATIAVYRASVAQARGDIPATRAAGSSRARAGRAPPTISPAAAPPGSSAWRPGRRAT